MLLILLCVKSSWLKRALEMFLLNAMVMSFCSTLKWHVVKACWLLQSRPGLLPISGRLLHRLFMQNLWQRWQWAGPIGQKSFHHEESLEGPRWTPCRPAAVQTPTQVTLFSAHWVSAVATAVTCFLQFFFSGCFPVHSRLGKLPHTPWLYAWESEWPKPY